MSPPPSWRRLPRASSTSPASSRPMPSLSAGITPSLQCSPIRCYGPTQCSSTLAVHRSIQLSFRRVVSSAIDRKELVDGYIYGFGAPPRARFHPAPGYVPVRSSAAGPVPSSTGSRTGGLRAAHCGQRRGRAGADAAGSAEGLPALMSRCANSSSPPFWPGSTAGRTIFRLPCWAFRATLRSATSVRSPRWPACGLPGCGAGPTAVADSVPAAFLYHPRGLQGMNRRVHGVDDGPPGRASNGAAVVGEPVSELSLRRHGAGSAGSGWRLDRRPALLRSRRGRRGNRRYPALCPGGSQLGGTGFRLDCGRPPRPAGGRRFLRTRSRRTTGPPEGRAPNTAGRWVHSDHPHRCAARLRTGQLRGPRRGPGGCLELRPRRDSRSESKSPKPHVTWNRWRRQCPGDGRTSCLLPRWLSSVEFRDLRPKWTGSSWIRNSWRDLSRRLVLCYTSASHFSGTTIERVMRAYEGGDSSVHDALHGLRDVADDMAGALVAADFSRVGQLLSQNWRHQLALDARMRHRKWPISSGQWRARARSAERRRVRAPAAACSSSLPMTPRQ